MSRTQNISNNLGTIYLLNISLENNPILLSGDVPMNIFIGKSLAHNKETKDQVQYHLQFPLGCKTNGMKFICAALSSRTSLDKIR